MGRQQDSAEADLAIRVEAYEGAVPVARLDRDYALVGRPEFEKRLGYATLPEVLEEVVPR